ncbi:hypothetical protein OYC64_001292 [Pagothenia borchgrevinki]|uniref:Uncharacterized protein n=1 Tax=Pagothenia borchgrevinki TaxID=8213 RepID=A0ABD2GB03_PAGBO
MFKGSAESKTCITSENLSSIKIRKEK